MTTVKQDTLHTYVQICMQTSALHSSWNVKRLRVTTVHTDQRRRLTEDFEQVDAPVTTIFGLRRTWLLQRQDFAWCSQISQKML